MLGMDVHDCGQASQDVYPKGDLAEGMVLTVEPGLYFQADDLLVPEEMRGIGIRIEDDILVTADGSRNLSASLPRTSIRRRGVDGRGQGLTPPPRVLLPLGRLRLSRHLGVPGLVPGDLNRDPHDQHTRRRDRVGRSHASQWIPAPVAQLDRARAF